MDMPHLQNHRLNGDEMIVDFHSHILPAVDDGSRNVHESLEMLRAMEQQKVDCVVATPHFYPNKIGLTDFLNNREKACDEIVSCRLTGTPSIKCGAEVAFFRGIGKSEQLDCLCIENTKLLLLEMPFRNWMSHDLVEIERIIDKGIIPILAHVERYYSLQRDQSIFRAIMQLPLYIQLNAEAFSSFRMRRIAFKIIDCGRPILLGSDCHNMKERYPNLSAGRKALQKKYGESFLADMDFLGEILLSTDSYTEERDT